MNIGVIFAGGVGKRMNSRVKPKQFIDVYGKPIIIHTLELFENHPEIDAIAVACLEDWIPYLQELLEKFNIKKVKKVVPGGASGQESIYNGLKAAEEIAAVFMYVCRREIDCDSFRTKLDSAVAKCCHNPILCFFYFR